MVVEADRVILDDKPIAFGDELVLYVNDSSGRPCQIQVSHGEATKVFRESDMPTRERLMSFWDKIVLPQRK
jgi:hypothetical protein